MLFTVTLCGCVGSPIHSTLTYNDLQSRIKKNNQALLQLKVGMQHAQVLGIMGQPERSEGYAWGSALLYRTAMTSGVYGTADSDFTPVMFNVNGELIGWGRNFFQEQIKRYEIAVEHK